MIFPQCNRSYEKFVQFGTVHMQRIAGGSLRLQKVSASRCAQRQCAHDGEQLRPKLQQSVQVSSEAFLATFRFNIQNATPSKSSPPPAYAIQIHAETGSSQ